MKELTKPEEFLKSKPYWTTKEARELIGEEFQVDFSEAQVRRILKEKLKMNFSKPYSLNYRRPSEAEEILAGNLNTVMSLLKEKGMIS